MSGDLSASAAVSQVVSTLPANGAARSRTHLFVVTDAVVVDRSAKVRVGPLRTTVRVASVKVASQAPVFDSTLVRDGDERRWYEKPVAPGDGRLASANAARVTASISATHTEVPTRKRAPANLAIPQPPRTRGAGAPTDGQ